jgi:hypothetical protein
VDLRLRDEIAKRDLEVEPRFSRLPNFASRHEIAHPSQHHPHQPFHHNSSHQTMRTKIITASPILRPIISLHKSPLRTFHLSCIMFSQTQPQQQFSSNYSPEQGLKEVNELLKDNRGKWDLIESGKGVERSFKFKTFKKTWVRFHFPLHHIQCLDIR